MKIPGAHPKIDTAHMSLESLATNRAIPDKEKVAEVSRQFEAVLLRQILQDIRKPVLGSEPESTTTSIYSDMINNQLAESISASGEFGLARSLQTQLSRQILPAKNPISEPKS
jgi:Rod binding domain-containing protein